MELGAYDGNLDSVSLLSPIAALDLVRAQLVSVQRSLSQRVTLARSPPSLRAPLPPHKGISLHLRGSQFPNSFVHHIPSLFCLT
mmetsp:Transcript_16054/g.32311  ORF Transcript_16054/g.32311 Transcript_16054/m.32311 type:complete len:84 (+) Transcript_16054:4504-4755(+)